MQLSAPSICTSDSCRQLVLRAVSCSTGIRGHGTIVPAAAYTQWLQHGLLAYW
jgi:hypothetical protein